jgi:hypothetical protein
MSTDTVADLRALRGRFDGALLAPGDPGWDEARRRRPWQLATDQHPAAVALPDRCRRRPACTAIRAQQPRRLVGARVRTEASGAT